MRNKASDTRPILRDPFEFQTAPRKAILISCKLRGSPTSTCMDTDPSQVLHVLSPTGPPP